MVERKTFHFEFNQAQPTDGPTKPIADKLMAVAAKDAEKLRQKEEDNPRWGSLVKSVLELEDEIEEDHRNDDKAKNEPTVVKASAELHLTYEKSKGSNGKSGKEEDSEKTADKDNDGEEDVFDGMEITPAVYLTLKKELDARMKLGLAMPFNDAQLLSGLTLWMAHNKKKLHLKDQRTMKDLQAFAARYIKQEKAKQEKKTHAAQDRKKQLTASEKKAHDYLHKHGIEPQHEGPGHHEAPEVEFEQNEIGMEVDHNGQLHDRGTRFDDDDVKLSPKQIEHQLFELAGMLDVSQAVGTLLLAQELVASADFGLKAATVLVEKYATRATDFAEKELCLSAIDMVAQPQDQHELKNTFADMKATESDFALKSHLAKLSGDQPESEMDARQDLMSEFRESMKFTERPVEDMSGYEPYQAEPIQQQATKAAVPPWMKVPSMPKAPTGAIFGIPETSE